MIEQNFGRYIIKHQLGKGGMATVYEAFDPRFERQVALKVLPREFLHDDSFRGRFNQEAKTIARLEHPAIVPVYDFGEEEGQPFLVMRYMSNGTLFNRLRSGAMAFAAAKKIVSRIALALQEAHEMGIVHRDVKPENILFDKFDEPYLSDFGIAKLAASSMTFTRGIIGTPQYMSPEQWRGKGDLDGRCDQYSLSIILYQLLTGGLPFTAAETTGFMLAHVSDPVPDITQKMPTTPAGIREFIEKSLAKDPNDRFDTMDIWREALSQIGDPELAQVSIKKRNDDNDAFVSDTAIQFPQGQDDSPIPSSNVPFSPTVVHPNEAETVERPQPPPLSESVPEIKQELQIEPQIQEPQPIESAVDPPLKQKKRWPAWIRWSLAVVGTLIGILLVGAVLDTLANSSGTPGTAGELTDMLGVEVVEIPGGDFSMGVNPEDENADPDEFRPQPVSLDTFWIGKYEITNWQYQAFVDETGWRPPSEWEDDEYPDGEGDFPVVGVSWRDAVAYTEWLSNDTGLLVRLPSEAEWEKAARGDGRPQIYPWGNTYDLNKFNGESDEPVDVGSFPAGRSPYGVFDMAGNAWEWTSSEYRPIVNRYQPELESLEIGDSKPRVVRGGSWSSGAFEIRISNRVDGRPDEINEDFGFRIVVEIVNE